MEAQCPRCLDLEDQVAQLHELAVSKGLIVDFSPGANPGVDARKEYERWRRIHVNPPIGVAWRAGWDRAWWFASAKLRDWNRRWEGWVRQDAVQRATIGRLLTEISRLTDSGGR